MDIIIRTRSSAKPNGAVWTTSSAGGLPIFL